MGEQVVFLVESDMTTRNSRSDTQSFISQRSSDLIIIMMMMCVVALSLRPSS